MTKNNILSFEYLNWEGKKAIRKVSPIKVWCGKTKWHKEKQWFLKAVDIEKDEERDFALRDVIKFF